MQGVRVSLHLGFATHHDFTTALGGDSENPRWGRHWVPNDWYYPIAQYLETDGATMCDTAGTQVVVKAEFSISFTLDPPREGEMDKTLAGLSLLGWLRSHTLPTTDAEGDTITLDVPGTTFVDFSQV